MNNVDYIELTNRMICNGYIELFKYIRSIYPDLNDHREYGGEIYQFYTNAVAQTVLYYDTETREVHNFRHINFESTVNNKTGELHSIDIDADVYDECISFKEFVNTRREAFSNTFHENIDKILIEKYLSNTLSDFSEQFIEFLLYRAITTKVLVIILADCRAMVDKPDVGDTDFEERIKEIKDGYHSWWNRIINDIPIMFTRPFKGMEYTIKPKFHFNEDRQLMITNGELVEIKMCAS